MLPAPAAGMETPSRGAEPSGALPRVPPSAANWPSRAANAGKGPNGFIPLVEFARHENRHLRSGTPAERCRDFRLRRETGVRPRMTNLPDANFREGPNGV